eukprot:9468020-Pyramimonas_sp.AAC.1
MSKRWRILRRTRLTLMVAHSACTRSTMTLSPRNPLRVSKVSREGARNGGEERDRALAPIWLGQ